MNEEKSFEPGALAQEYCRRRGWDLKRRNIMVEGDSDVRYFTLASDLHYKKFQKRLLGVDFGCFSAGTGDSGGVEGVARELATLKNVIDNDRDPNSKAIYGVVGLLDDDYAGRVCAAVLKNTWRYREGREYFRLRRNWPMKSNEPILLGKHLAEVGQDSFTELEDLLSPDFVDSFFEERPEAKQTLIVNGMGQRHYNLVDRMKGPLWLYTRDNAMYEDVALIVDCLKAIRFYVGLPVDGC